jgi:small subunit ribosomal protein S4
MGDPRKLRKKYEVPQVLWDDERIAEEGGLVADYGLKNIREVWVAKAELRKIRRQYRDLLGLGVKGAEKMSALLQKVIKLGYAPTTASVEALLSLHTRNILERRLQTIVFRNGLANSIRQARQLIVHGFISVGGKKVSAPSYRVSVDLEEKIAYYKPIDLEKVGTKSKSEEKIAKTIEAIGETAGAVETAIPAAEAGSKEESE